MMPSLQTLRSLRRPGGGLYWQIDCFGDYRFRDFLAVGARNERELLRFLKRTFLPWVPLPMPRVPDFGCSTFTARTPEGHGKIPITTTTAVRLLLDRAATVDEALDLLARYDMHHAIGSAFHFHIADASGTSAVVEWDPDGAARIIRAATSVPERGRLVRPVVDAPDSSGAAPFVPLVCTNF